MSKKNVVREKVYKNAKGLVLIQKLIYERLFFGPTLISSIIIVGQWCGHLAMNIDF
jgi:hypothetical protein